MLLLTRLAVDGGYASHVLPAEILLGLGMGGVFVPAISTATQRVDRRDTGVAAAVVNTSQQLGGSIGVALLNTVAGSATAGYLATPPVTRLAHTAALVHGYAAAAAWAAGILAATAAVVAVLVTAATSHPGPARPAAATTKS